MPNKAYGILYYEEDEDTGYLYFPIKLSTAVAYPGMPQFFGGSKHANETDLATVSRETLEESNNQVTVNALKKKIYAPAVGADQYSFYIVTDYSGQHFLGPLPGNPEMASIAKFLVQAGGEDTVDDLFQRLGITMTAEFAQSETYTAFEKALAWAQQS